MTAYLLFALLPVAFLLGKARRTDRDDELTLARLNAAKWAHEWEQTQRLLSCAVALLPSPERSRLSGMARTLGEIARLDEVEQ